MFTVRSAHEQQIAMALTMFRFTVKNDDHPTLLFPDLSNKLAVQLRITLFNVIPHITNCLVHH